MAGCGGGSGGGSKAGAAEVSSFDVTDPDCAVANTAPVMVTWATSDATAVDVAVDDLRAKGYGPSGSATVLVPCDGASHKISVTPKNDAGTGKTETKTVST